MKLNFNIEKTTEEYKALSVILANLGHEICDCSCVKKITLTKIDSEELSVSVCDGSAEIVYSSLTSLIRGVGLIIPHLDDKSFKKAEKPRFKTLAPMIDCSRNAVPTIDTLKDFAVKMAIMGYNAMMLYTEDTYEVDEFPYFGHLRGRYSHEELRELDAFCADIGIELIPCIQTLAHLNAIFYWQTFTKDYKDCDDILLAGDQKVYDFIECMLKSMSENLKSRRINIGMDEAHMLGRGKYTDRFGYKARPEIIIAHLEKVMELCRKYGYEPMMWSDMFFRMASPTNAYYDMNVSIPEEVKSKVPSDVELVYWDYYGTNEAKYDKMFSEHSKFNNKIAFAGGTSCWYGLVPLSQFSINSARVALKYAFKYNMETFLVTMWGDNGATCSIYSSLPTLVLYAESCWGNDSTDDELEIRMIECTGASYKAFLELERVQDLPTRTNYGTAAVNSARYMLFQDPMLGLYDYNVPDGCNARFAEVRDMLADKRACVGKYDYVFDSIIAMADFLSVKAEIGKILKAAYDAKDNAKLAQIRDELLPACVEKATEFKNCLRTQWYRENKRFGYEIQSIRIGGLIERLNESIYLIDLYLNGKISSLEELEADRLPNDCKGANLNSECVLISPNNWDRFVSPSK